MGALLKGARPVHIEEYEEVLSAIDLWSFDNFQEESC
jgi:hypothetical protein